jgi:hypothetical protein
LTRFALSPKVTNPKNLKFLKIQAESRLVNRQQLSATAGGHLEKAEPTFAALITNSGYLAKKSPRL